METRIESYKNLTPGQLADLLLEMTAQYSEYADELTQILKLKDLNWSVLRETTSSDKQADRKWHQTSPGIRERELECELKKLKQIQSNIKAVLKVRADEAHSLY